MGFFDKMKTSVSGVSAQQRYASAIRKISAQIQSNEKEIARLTEQVGIQCVNLHLDEKDTEYENLFAVIRQYQREISEAKGEIQRLREHQQEEEFARQQALQKKEEADRIARQQAQEAREAARMQAQAEKEAKVWQQAQAEKEAKAWQQVQVERAEDVTQEADHTEGKICSSCGGENDEDALFCVHCGNLLQPCQEERQAEQSQE